MWQKQATARQCSFCHQSESEHGVKLISNPEDYPRAYICDGCIAVCASILEDDREMDALEAAQSQHSHSLLELLACVEQWITREASGNHASDELTQLRALARQMFVKPDV